MGTDCSDREALRSRQVDSRFGRVTACSPSGTGNSLAWDRIFAAATNIPSTVAPVLIHVWADYSLGCPGNVVTC